MLGYEASRGLEEIIVHGVSAGIINLARGLGPSSDRPQQSPISPFTGSVVKHRVGFTPILRAGLGMTDALLTLFPCVCVSFAHPCRPRDLLPDFLCEHSDAPVYHLGIYREKVSLQPVECQSIINHGSLRRRLFSIQIIQSYRRRPPST